MNIISPAMLVAVAAHPERESTHQAPRVAAVKTICITACTRAPVACGRHACMPNTCVQLIPA